MKEKIQKIFKDRTDDISIQFFRYFFVGGIAFVVDFGSLYAFTEYLHLFYLVSATFAFILGLTTNYLLSIAWVFNKRKMASKWVEFGVFAIIGMVGLGLNDLIMWFFTGIVLFHYLISKLIATAAVFLWNFFVRKLTLFK